MVEGSIINNIKIETDEMRIDRIIKEKLKWKQNQKK